jgi:Spy/CpxP family protein refolding chaperone
MLKKILIGLGALAVVIAAGAAWAQGARRGMMKQMITAKVAQAEDLIQATPQQRTQIETSRDAVIAALQSAHKDRKDAHAQLVNLWLGDKLDPAALNAVVSQRATEMQAVTNAIVQEVVKVHDVLTPEQRKTLADNWQKLGGRHQHPKGGFGGPGE